MIDVLYQVFITLMLGGNERMRLGYKLWRKQLSRQVCPMIVHSSPLQVHRLYLIM